MSAQSTLRKSMLLGVAAAASAAGLMVAAAPVKAIPPVPLARATVAISSSPAMCS